MRIDAAKFADDWEQLAMISTSVSRNPNCERLHAEIEVLKTDVAERSGGRFTFHGSIGLSERIDDA